MAKFTAPVALNMRLPGGFEVAGAAGATHRIPDALVEEFTRDNVPTIPGGVTWITQDETSGIPALPLAQSDISNLTSDLGNKYDKAGGTVSGAVTATGAIAGATLSAAGAISGASVSVVGAANASAVTATGAGTFGSVIAPAVTATSARFKGDPHFNVKAYGATGDGSTNDRAALQAAIDAAIVAGGIVYMPPGTYKISTPLDFSALKGTLRGVTLEGAGSGGIQSGDSAAATILNDSASAAIIAYGSLAGTSSLAIEGLRLCNFRVKNAQGIGSSNYTIDFDYVTGMFQISDVIVYGQNLGGNGIRLRNIGHGQSTLDRVTVRGFNAGAGIRISVETTSNVDVAPNSGNIAAVACQAIDVLTGWDIQGVSNLLDGGSLVACKAVNISDIVGSIGFRLRDSTTNWTLTSPHSERFSTGYSIENADYNTLLSPLATFPSGTPDAASTGIRHTSSATGNVALGAQLNQTHYGVRYEGSARTNFVIGSDFTSARVLTQWSADVSTGKSNITWKTEGEDPFDLVFGHAKVSLTQVVYQNPISPSTLTTNTENWDPSASVTGVIRVAASTTINLGGLVKDTSGERLTLVNVGSFTITIVHGSGGSTAANQFFCPGSANFSLRSNGSVDVWYDGTSSRWRVIAP